MQLSAELKQYLALKKWKHRPAGDGKNIAVRVCPLCGKDKWKFYIRMERPVYRCWNCNESGNLYKLKRELGDLAQLVSAASAASGGRGKKGKPISMEHIDRWHKRLMGDERALEYCTKRGLRAETLQHFKVGLQPKKGINWLAIPHINEGVCHNVKFRALPPADKMFRRVKGSASVLFNSDILADHQEIVLVEGELDAMSYWQAGIKNVIGLTGGADTFLPEWYDLLADREGVTLVLDADAVGQEGARNIARRLGFDRCTNVLLPLKDANDVLVQLGKEELKRTLGEAEQFDVHGIVSLDEVLQQCATKVEVGDDGLTTPWYDVNRIIGRQGWQPGDLIVLSAKIKVGKALAHGEKVWTPRGEVAIEDLEVGDPALGSDGHAYSVTGVFPQGVRKIYRVTFSDGAHLDVDGEHLWAVNRYTDGSKRYQDTLSTTNLLWRGLERPGGGWRFSVPMPEPLRLAKRRLPIPPYTMGVCLGDGCLTQDGLRIANSNVEIRCRVASLLPKSMRLRDVDGVTFSLSNRRRGGANPLSHALRTYGLKGCVAAEKYIPRPYLLSAVADRVALLQGLMDTDGTIGKTNGQLSYSTASVELADDVRFLVETLGGRCSIGEKFIQKYQRTYYDVRLSLPRSVVPFSKPSKLDRFNSVRSKKRARNFRSIVGIEPIGNKRATCISVGSPDSLFVAHRGIVTHNTTWALQVLNHLADQGHPGLMYCLEMRPKRLVQKVVSAKRKKAVEDLQVIDYQLTRYYLRHLPLYFVEPEWGGGLKVEMVMEKIREAVKRYGIKIVVFDHLHFLCRSLQYLTNEVGNVCRMFKLIAEELEVVVILIAQPKKIQGDRVIKYDDIKDSSAIPADADQIILLHRDSVPAGEGIDADEASEQEVLEPKMLVRVDAGRFVGGGEAYLYYQGEIATMIDWSERPARKF